MIQAFTGPSRMTKRQWMWAAERIAALEPVADVWRSGCASGLDTLGAYIAHAFREFVDLELYVPSAPHNETLVRQLAYVSRVIRCPETGSLSDAYRLRNESMLNGVADLIPARAASRVDRLHAFVTEEDFYRSGEWMTINIARRLGVEIVKDVLPR